jgi:hypothetical protein
MTVKVLLGVETWQDRTSNTIVRVNLVEEVAAPPNPNAVDLSGDAAGGMA